MTAILRFKTEVGAKNERVDWVLLAPRGEGGKNATTWHRVDKLKPKRGLGETDARSDHHLAMKARWELIEPAYNAWKDGYELPEDGTPLAAWSGVTADFAQILRNFGVKTVEGVRDLSEGDLQRIPVPDLRKLKTLAQEYLEQRPMAEVQAELALARERLAAMEEMLEGATQPGDPADQKADVKAKGKQKSPEGVKAA
jgi:hypothetical protein